MNNPYSILCSILKSTFSAFKDSLMTKYQPIISQNAMMPAKLIAVGPLNSFSLSHLAIHGGKCFVWLMRRTINCQICLVANKQETAAFGAQAMTSHHCDSHEGEKMKQISKTLKNVLRSKNQWKKLSSHPKDLMDVMLSQPWMEVIFINSVDLSNNSNEKSQISECTACQKPRSTITSTMWILRKGMYTLIT